jgi:hypothetical protein
MSNKIRIWDTKLLTNTYAVVAQMKAQIETIVQQTGVTSLQVLPNSMIPTDKLYEIATCYEILYNRLLDQDLLNSGNIKQTQLKELH